MAIYNVNGNEISTGGGGAVNYDTIVKAVAHRGYSKTAPENTLPAYQLAKQMGFFYVEADICWTSDGIPVLSHDTTIDRCSDGSGTIANMTLTQLRQYDFGSWKSPEYAGTKIPTAEEFFALCRALGLHPYIDPRDTNATKLQAVIDIYTACGLKGNVTWIGNSTAVTNISSRDTTARLGMFATNTITSTMINTIQALKTDDNEVFLDADNSYATDSGCELCADAALPLEVWTVDNAATILAMNPYITGVTSNYQIAGKLLYDANIN